MRFSRSLARLRKEKKVSQRTAAGALGVSQALLSHYENGLREPGLEFLVNASRYYGCSVDCLLGIQPPAASAGAPRGAGLAAEAAGALHTFAGDAGDDRLAALADEYLLAAAYRFALTLCGGPQRTLSAVDALMKADELAVCAQLERLGAPLDPGALPAAALPARDRIEQRLAELEKSGFVRGART